MQNLVALVALLAVAPVSPAAARDATPPASLPSAACARASAGASVATPGAEATPDAAALAAIDRLPLDHLPAQVSRGVHAERGTLALALPDPLAALQVTADVTSGAAGPIGRVVHENGFLLFTFDEITYDVTPIQLPTGHQIDAQTIHLDSSQSSTL
jgi:hypothetical protein